MGNAARKRRRAPLFSQVKIQTLIYWLILHNSKLLSLEGAAVAVVVVTLAIAVAVLANKHSHKRVKKEIHKNIVKERQEMLSAKSTGKSSRIFTGREITKATNNFSKDTIS